jgi:tetratricopeptide (TPR) repeat protein
VLLEVGTYEEALFLMRRAQGMADSVSPPILRFFTLWISGIVYQTLLRLDEARAALEEAAALIDTALLQTHKALLVFPLLCASYTLAGEREQAYSYALEAHMERERIGISSTMFDFYRDYETNALLLHSEKQAEDVVRRFIEQAGDHRRFRIVALRAQAALAQKYDDVKLAIEYLREAVQLTEAIGLPGTRWQIQAALGRLYQKQGEGERELSAQAFALAMRTIQQLAERMQDEEIRATFLSAPQIQEIIASQEYHPDSMRQEDVSL